MRFDGCQHAPGELSTRDRPSPMSAGLLTRVVELAQHRFERFWRSIGVGTTAAAILGVTLYPFEWAPPRTLNGAAYRAGGLEFFDMGIARSTVAPPWLTDAIKANKLEIELTVDAASARQGGPARILTLSRDINCRNLTIGQEGRDLVIRLRTPNTDDNGMPPITISDVFGQSGWVTIRMDIGSERLTIWIDDVLTLDQPLPPAPLKRWDASYQLVLGNELTGDRAWLGKIARAVVAVGSTSIDYAAPGALEVPQPYWFFHRRFNFVPLVQTSWGDCLNNVLLFLPMGIILGLAAWRDRRWHSAKLLLLISSLSTVIEALQLCVPGRYPSLNDILFNTMGGILGLALARWLARQPALRESKRNRSAE